MSRLLELEKQPLANRHEANSAKLASLTGLCLLLTAFVYPAHASEASEIVIEGATAVFNQEQNTIVYAGDVEATLNDLMIHGDKLLVQMDEEKISSITTSGNPATFTQQGRSANSNDTATAKAKTIIFYPAENLLELLRDASLVQGGNAVASDRIRYNIGRGEIDAGSMVGTKEERVRMQLIIPASRSDQDE